MKYHAYNIVYETDGENVKLPTEMVVDVEDAFQIADAISDETGWLVKSYDADLIRGGYIFRDTFDAGLDRNSGQVDIYGVDVYTEDQVAYQGHIDWVDTDALAEMSFEEFSNFITKNRETW